MVTERPQSDALQGEVIAILLPCFNEAAAIQKVLRDLHVALPSAEVYVYDNNSTDNTAELAQRLGAVVRNETLQGKGNVLRRMFADIEADLYVMLDGDDTYNIGDIVVMIHRLKSEGLDLVNGRRVSSADNAYRPGHRFGNRILTRMVASIFGRRLADMLSGAKVLSRRFVKSFPCLTGGFEIETEIAVHALELKMPIGEVPIAYRERGPGSTSKLRTFRDGLKIGWLIFRLIRVERPVIFFGSIFVLLAIISSVMGWQIFWEWERTHLVLRMPTAVLCTGTMIVAVLSAMVGAILETVTLGRRETKRMVYLSLPPNGEPAPRRTNAGVDNNARR